MKIDRKSFPYLFNEYELSLSYKKSQLVRRNLTEQMLRLNEKPNEYYAIRYAYCNGYEQNSMDEKLALWFNYNLRINDLLYKNFKVEFVSESFAKTASDNAKSLLNSAGDMSYFELFGTSSGTMVLSSEYAVQYAIQKDGSCFFSYDLKNIDIAKLTEGRIDTWKHGIAHFGENELFGVGFYQCEDYS